MAEPKVMKPLLRMKGQKKKEKKKHRLMNLTPFRVET
jgi:hypothetical protein